MYHRDILTLKLCNFILVLNRTTDKWPNQEVKGKQQNILKILIHGPICCTTLHYSKKCMKKYVRYNPGQVIF